VSAPAGERAMTEVQGARVLLAVASPEARELLAAMLRDEGHRVRAVGGGVEALRELGRARFDVVLVDLALEGMSGLALLAAAATLPGDARSVAIDRRGDSRQSVEAMKLGAFDVISPPFRAGAVVDAVAQAWRELALRRAAAPGADALRRGVRARLVGRSPAMERLFALIERVAPTRATVLITGETGTGKELVARAIHELSGRAARPFVPVNCSALPETLLESELFGHVKGSFTGAIASRRGLVEEAHGGTLFLDEIATISPLIQVKLLRVLQDRMVTRIGGTQPTMVDFRLVAATNASLAAEVAAGRFREDLYYRLDVFGLTVPPLRERREDIPLLAEHFRARYARESGCDAPPFGARALERMMAYGWPGNVRELENAVERAVVLHGGGRTLPFEPPSGAEAAPRGASTRPRTLDAVEREHILGALEAAHGNRLRAALALGIDRCTLHRKLRRWRDAGLDAPPPGPEGRATA
jgi:DNA-binding NtrC family response regulator